MAVFALIPLKDPSEAKTRLSPYLSREERAGLAKAMLRDVLKAVSSLVVPVIITTAEVEAEGCHILKEERSEGLTKAVEKGVSYALEQGAEATLFIPADTPLIKKRHIEDILSLGRKHRLILSPARKGGVGILYKRPPDLLPEHFSSTSFPDIINMAEMRGLDYYIYDSFYLSLDIDTREDILEFFHHGQGTETYRFLKKYRDRFLKSEL